MKGTVKWFSAQKGYGFITDENGNDTFVHYSGIEKGRTFLAQGDEVDFNTFDGENGPQAGNVKITKLNSKPKADGKPSKDKNDQNTEAEAPAEQ